MRTEAAGCVAAAAAVSPCLFLAAQPQMHAAPVVEGMLLLATAA